MLVPPLKLRLDCNLFGRHVILMCTLHHGGHGGMLLDNFFGQSSLTALMNL